MEYYSEAQKRASLKYQKENIVNVKFTLNRNTESDLIEWLSGQDNKQGYLKELIRADMEKNK